MDFELNLEKFTCLVGLNGAGKSTVLQAMDFLSQLMIGNLDDWLKQRQWDSADLNSKLTSKSNINFKVVVDHPNFGEIIWSGSVNRKSLNCTSERVEVNKAMYLRVDDAYCTIARDINTTKILNEIKVPHIAEKFPIVFEYQGSILSGLKESQINPALQALKNVIVEIRSLDLLSPELLRSRNKSADGKLGLGGEKLSAFIHESGFAVKEKLKSELVSVYTQLESVETKSLRSGWKQLEITERFGDQKLKTTARHMNDGMLRLMAVLAQLEAGSDFLLFDEIENGINPELIEYLIDHLVKAKQQIVVTTHSPMILNYLEDETAKKGVVCLYKNTHGLTRAIRLFDIPSMAKKLEFMGPGEAFIDTDLTNLHQEIEVINLLLRKQ
ncbi:RecF/RecN/SMC N terminal domain, putative [Cellvibrio sp. BR]|nr:RecF/RecN/SMC N terminal domain, putative [Cellvibrio sp. BR]